MHIGSTTIHLKREEFAEFVAAADHALSHISRQQAESKNDQFPNPPWVN